MHLLSDFSVYPNYRMTKVYLAPFQQSNNVEKAHLSVDSEVRENSVSCEILLFFDAL